MSYSATAKRWGDRLEDDRLSTSQEATTSSRCTTTEQPTVSTGASAAWKYVSDEKFETAKLLIAGGVAGAVSKSMTAPLARLTILYQVQGMQIPVAGRVCRMGMVQGLSQVVHREGIAALWKGNMATIIHRLPYSSINFWAYERLTEVLRETLPPDPHYGSTDIVRRLLAGGAAGMIACTVAYPLDLVRTRLAVQTSGSYYHGILPTMRTIILDEGLTGLYRGLGATLLQVAPSLAINYATYETLRGSLIAKQGTGSRSPTIATSLACGSIAGLVSSTVTFPLDLVRRRMQLVGQGGNKVRHIKYSHVFKEILQKEGVKGLYAGIVPEYTKVIPGVAIAFCTYEMMKQCLGVRTRGMDG